MKDSKYDVSYEITEDGLLKITEKYKKSGKVYKNLKDKEPSSYEAGDVANETLLKQDVVRNIGLLTYKEDGKVQNCLEVAIGEWDEWEDSDAFTWYIDTDSVKDYSELYNWFKK